MKGTTALAMICGFVFAIGCAAGTEQDFGDDGFEPDAMDNPNVVIDAHPLPIDANPLPIDANIPIDASLPIDAAAGLPEGSECTGSAQCASACCLLGFNACFPDPGTPGFCL